MWWLAIAGMNGSPQRNALNLLVQAAPRVLLVSLPEATPVHEAAALQEDLRRAQIEPFAWIINQSFATSGSCNPLLLARGRSEVPYIREVAETLSPRSVLVPWVPEEPVGPDKLRQLFSANHAQPTQPAI